MKSFKIVPAIAEYSDFAAFAKEINLGPTDLILTNEYIYKPFIEKLELPCGRIYLFSGEVRRRRADRHHGRRDPRQPARQEV